jgi:hypothetical protein
MERVSDQAVDTSADHGITINESQPRTGTPLQALCLCGWTSPAVAARAKAREHGIAHLALMNATLAEIISEIERRPSAELAAALAGLTEPQLLEVQTAVAAAVGERYVWKATR